MTLAGFFLVCGLQTLIGLVVDYLMGDPAWFPHPARGVGRLVARLEQALRPRSRDLRRSGVVLCAATVLAATGSAVALMALLASADAWLQPARAAWFAGGWRSVPWCSLIGGGIVCGIWFSWRSLSDEAIRVHRLLRQGDLAGARRALAGIVGRDTDRLDEREIARATVETVGENSVDGGLAPVFFALLGGPVLVTLFKAASTLDSMVGYRNERYRDMGMASAKLDDALNFVPARLAMVFIPIGAALAGLRPVDSVRIGWRDHARHPSPNSAWGESLFAGALGVQLGGLSTYGGVPSAKPLLGEPSRPMEAARIPEAVRLLQATAVAVALASAGMCVALWQGV